MLPPVRWVLFLFFGRVPSKEHPELVLKFLTVLEAPLILGSFVKEIFVAMIDENSRQFCIIEDIHLTRAGVLYS